MIDYDFIYLKGFDKEDGTPEFSFGSLDYLPKAYERTRTYREFFDNFHPDPDKA